MAKPKSRRMDSASTIRVPKNQVDPTRMSEKMGRVADFSGVSDYKTISAGQYELEAVSFEWKDPKDDGRARDTNPATNKPYQYANVKIVVKDETDENGEKVQGHVLFDKFSENPKSLFALKRAAIAFGEDPELFDGPVDLDVVLGNMMGRSALGQVSVREFTRADGSVAMSNDITKYESIEQPTSVSASRR